MNEETIWPGNIQCAVTVTVNFDGESVEQREKPDEPLWGRMSFGRYGAQTGIQRILDLLARWQIRATVFVPAWDVEHYPAVMQLIAGAGHEVAGHGYIHEDFSDLSFDEQRDVLARSESAFENTFGSRPAGWRAPRGLMTSDTRPLLIERGYRYDSSFCDDDVPYVVEGDAGRRMVELPVFATASDSYYYRVRRSPDVVERAWRMEFLAMYEVGGLFNLTIHPRGDFGSGRAVRLRALEGLLQTIQSYPRVWTTTCGELADWALGPDSTLDVWPA